MVSSPEDPPPDDEKTRIVLAARGQSFVGEVLGHTYRIEALLGKGGMGAVYRARHLALETEHAIKIILPEFAEDRQFVSLIEHEAKSLGRVSSDAVVDYQGLFLDEKGHRYLVMEYVDGPSLASLLRERSFSVEEVRTLRDRLASGLAAAHEKGVFHRDISPDNVILPGGRIEQAKIIDFGIAKSTEAGERTIIGTEFAGKYSFASPEQVGLNGGIVDARSDIYSLALVLAAAAIGKGGKLDMGNSPSAMIEARQRQPDLSRLPAALRAELAPMLAPRPEDRPGSMRELAQPAAAPAPHRGSRLPALAVALALAVLGAAAGGYFVLGTEQSEKPGEPVAAAPSPPLAEPAAEAIAEGPAAAPATNMESAAAEAPARSEPAPTVAALPPATAKTAEPSAAAEKPQPEPVAAVVPAAMPSAPAPPRPAVARAEIDRILGGFRCAGVTAELGDDAVRLRGFVASEAERARLRDEVAAIAALPVSEKAVGILAPPLCEVVSTVTAGAAIADGAPRITPLGGRNGVFAEGDELVLRVAATSAPLPYLLVDFIDPEGSVLHMWPTPKEPHAKVKPGEEVTLGTSRKRARPGEDVYEIAAPFGRNLILVVASAEPLFASARPRVETLAAYLPVLQQRLGAAGRIQYAYLPIDTVARAGGKAPAR